MSTTTLGRHRRDPIATLPRPSLRGIGLPELRERLADITEDLAQEFRVAAYVASEPLRMHRASPATPTDVPAQAVETDPAPVLAPSRRNRRLNGLWEATLRHGRQVRDEFALHMRVAFLRERQRAVQEQLDGLVEVLAITLREQTGVRKDFNDSWPPYSEVVARQPQGVGH
jgi:hypothetical protein